MSHYYGYPIDMKCIFVRQEQHPTQTTAQESKDRNVEILVSPANCLIDHTVNEGRIESSRILICACFFKQEDQMEIAHQKESSKSEKGRNVKNESNYQFSSNNEANEEKLQHVI